MKKTARLELTENNPKIIVINPSKQTITEHFVGINDKKEFSSFCYSNGLQWLFQYFSTMDKFSESIGGHLEMGTDDYIEAAKFYGLRLKKMGTSNYLLAIDLKDAPANMKDREVFCSTRPGYNEKFCDSAIIFSVEPYNPGGYGTGIAGSYIQTDCRLSTEQISELYSFDCNPDPTNEKSVSNEISVASLTESAETEETATVQTIGQVIPYSKGSIKQINISIPKYYSDALIKLGEAFKGEQVNFFSIPYDMGITPVAMQVPEYLISILGDLYERLGKREPGAEG